jgi:hypothetical protein
MIQATLFKPSAVFETTSASVSPVSSIFRGEDSGRSGRTRNRRRQHPVSWLRGFDMVLNSSRGLGQFAILAFLRFLSPSQQCAARCDVTHCDAGSILGNGPEGPPEGYWIRLLVMEDQCTQAAALLKDAYGWMGRIFQLKPSYEGRALKNKLCLTSRTLVRSIHSSVVSGECYRELGKIEMS